MRQLTSVSTTPPPRDFTGSNNNFPTKKLPMKAAKTITKDNNNPTVKKVAPFNASLNQNDQPTSVKNVKDFFESMTNITKNHIEKNQILINPSNHIVMSNIESPSSPNKASLKLNELKDSIQQSTKVFDPKNDKTSLTVDSSKESNEVPLINNNAKHQSQINALNDQIDELNKKLKGAEGIHNQFEESVKLEIKKITSEFHVQINVLNGQIDGLQKKLKVAEDMNNQFQKSHKLEIENITSEFSAQTNGLKSEIDGLQKKLKVAEDMNNQFKKSHKSEIEKIKSEFQEKISELQAKEPATTLVMNQIESTIPSNKQKNEVIEKKEINFSGAEILNISEKSPSLFKKVYTGTKSFFSFLSSEIIDDV